MSLNYYFDGCSYTKGHDIESVGYAWPFQINPQVGRSEGFKNPIDESDEYCKYPYINNACIARSNDAIFTNFIVNLDNIIRNKTKVFLYFSHNERFFNGFEISSKKQYRNFPTRMKYEKANPRNNIPIWIAGTMKTIAFIKSITTIAKDHNIDLVIVTQDHYRWFEFVSKLDKSIQDCFNSIDQKYIFNWPLPELKNFSFFNTYPDDISETDQLELWGCTGFALQIAKGFSDFNSWVSKDLKHFTEEGHKWLANALLEFSKDKSKNLAYYINDLDIGKQRLFYDKNAWVESYFYGKEPNHWVENKLIEHFQTLISDIKTNKNFIYEE